VAVGVKAEVKVEVTVGVKAEVRVEVAVGVKAEVKFEGTLGVKARMKVLRYQLKCLTSTSQRALALALCPSHIARGFQ